MFVDYHIVVVNSIVVITVYIKRLWLSKFDYDHEKKHTLLLLISFISNTQLTDDFEIYSYGENLILDVNWTTWGGNSSFKGSDSTSLYAPFKGTKMSVTGNNVAPVYGIWLAAKDWVFTVYTKIVKEYFF